MGKFIKRHQESVLIFVALVLLGIIIAYFVWGINILTVNLNRAVNPEKNSLTQKTQFEIEAAKEVLKQRGLAQ
jgi:hypothetical protein